MSYHLLHGELSATRQASECFEPACRIVRRFINSVSQASGQIYDVT
jgi:hypothetical protein